MEGMLLLSEKCSKVDDEIMKKVDPVNKHLTIYMRFSDVTLLFTESLICEWPGHCECIDHLPLLIIILLLLCHHDQLV